MAVTRIITQAPTRIDFAGGWTDTPPYSAEKGGSVVNAAINLYMKVELTIGKRDARKNVIIKSIDYGATVEADSIADLRLDGELDFAKAALRSLPIEGPFELVTESDTPAGSGLGGSGALGVALTKALILARGEELVGTNLPERAHDIEVNELKVLGGKQDQYAGMFGGFRYMTFNDPVVEMLPLPMLDTTINDFRENSILAYTGQSHFSGMIHQNVVDEYNAGNVHTLEFLDEIKTASDKMKEAMLANDLKAFAAMLNKNWQAQKALHPSITNETIDAAFIAARKNGAIAGKALGAGGGGCLYFYCRKDTKNQVEKALNDTGCQSLSFDFDFKGLTSEVQSSDIA